MIEIEFVVPGTPRAWRARTRAKWQERVRDKAVASVGRVLDGPIGVHIIYFHHDPAHAIDVDNMAKPVLDALKEVAFTDDRLVEELLSRRTMISLDSRNPPITR